MFEIEFHFEQLKFLKNVDKKTKPEWASERSVFLGFKNDEVLEEMLPFVDDGVIDTQKRATLKTMIPNKVLHFPLAF